MIEVRGLTKRYGELVALSAVSLRVMPGELAVVLGPSGAGKSTLLRCINRLAAPDAGEVLIAGQPVLADRTRLRATRREVAMIFQDHNLVPRLSVLKNVLTGRLAYMPVWQSVMQFFPVRDVELAMECLRRVQLEDRAWSRADRLSGGQQQRVGVARALAQQPRAILADEPVASLDPKNARVILSDLRRAAHELNIAVLCNLHQVGYAREFADRIVGISGGRVVFDGQARDIDSEALSRIYPGLDPEHIDEQVSEPRRSAVLATASAAELAP
jgi:phosphonate transport system ATP-binding protein